MKKILMAAAALCCAMSIEAQGLLKPSKMSPWLRGQYRQQQEAVKQSGGRLRAQGRPVMKYMLMLVESTDQAQSLREKGGVVLQDFDDGTPVRIYTTDGRLVAAATLVAGTVTLPVTASTGVFAVQVGKQGSTLIRL